MRPLIATILSAAILAAAPAAAAKDKPSGEEKLAKMLDGRVAGEPQDCITLSSATSSQIVDKTAVVYRIGSYIPVPGIDPAAMLQLMESQKGTIVDMFNMFSGGALNRFSLFALNVIPYISASIIVQLMGHIFDPWKALKKVLVFSAPSA